jgi:hypothetical protein
MRLVLLLVVLAAALALPLLLITGRDCSPRPGAGVEGLFLCREQGR